MLSNIYVYLRFEFDYIKHSIVSSVIVEDYFSSSPFSPFPYSHVDDLIQYNILISNVLYTPFVFRSGEELE